jgi:hypothetical protein
LLKPRRCSFSLYICRYFLAERRNVLLFWVSGHCRFWASTEWIATFLTACLLQKGKFLCRFAILCYICSQQKCVSFPRLCSLLSELLDVLLVRHWRQELEINCWVLPKPENITSLTPLKIILLFTKAYSIRNYSSLFRTVAILFCNVYSLLHT